MQSDVSSEHYSIVTYTYSYEIEMCATYSLFFFFSSFHTKSFIQMWNKYNRNKQKYRRKCTWVGYIRWSRVNNAVNNAVYSQSAHALAHARAQANIHRTDPVLSGQMSDDDWLMSAVTTQFFLLSFLQKQIYTNYILRNENVPRIEIVEMKIMRTALHHSHMERRCK